MDKSVFDLVITTYLGLVPHLSLRFGENWQILEKLYSTDIDHKKVNVNANVNFQKLENSMSMPMSIV